MNKNSQSIIFKSYLFPSILAKITLWRIFTLLAGLNFAANLDGASKIRNGAL